MLVMTQSNWNSHVAGTNAENMANLRNSLAVYHIKHMLIIPPTNPTPKYFPKEIKCTSTQKPVCEYHLTLTRMATIKQNKIKQNKTENNKCWWGCENLESLRTVGRMENGTATVENSMAAPQRIKNRGIWVAQLVNTRLLISAQVMISSLWDQAPR